MIRYNPFQKPFADITAENLSVLRTTSEGWYVEYKEVVPDTRSIAKSVSAFANHYGGWVFYGIKESSDGLRTAGSFPGMPRDEAGAFETRIRDAVTSLIHPPPFFISRVLEGPTADIGEGRCIIAVMVPPGADPPYVHGSGRIFRRVADESEPKPETDRTTLDLLWERGRRARTRLEDRVARQPKVSKAEAHRSYLHLHIIPDLLGAQELRSTVRFDTFANILRSATRQDAELLFDNAFTSPTGYLARQAGKNDPKMRLMTYEYDFDLSARVTLPLDLINSDGGADALYKYRAGRKFNELLQAQNLFGSLVIDLNALFVVLAGVLRKHEELMTHEGHRHPVQLKASFTGMWRKVPFVDTKGYLRFIKQHGIPVLQDDQFLVPEGKDPTSFFEMNLCDVKAHKEPVPLVTRFLKLPIFYTWLTAAMGIPEAVISRTFVELLYAFHTAVNLPLPDGWNEEWNDEDDLSER